MLQRLASVCLAAGLAIAAGGCCTYPVASGDPVACGHTVGIGDCGSGGYAAAPCDGGVPNAKHPMLTHGSGCGEVYWGEWINDPPSDCDPCDSCGNWIGPVAHPGCWNPLAGLRHLWGYRFAPADCDLTPAAPVELDLPAEEETVPEKIVPPKPEPEPTPAARQASAKRRVRHATYYRPYRTMVR